MLASANSSSSNLPASDQLDGGVPPARCIPRSRATCRAWQGPMIARADSAVWLVITAPVAPVLSCISSNCRGDFNRGSLEGSTRDPLCGRSACHREKPTTPCRPCQSGGDGAIRGATPRALGGLKRPPFLFAPGHRMAPGRGVGII